MIVLIPIEPINEAHDALIVEAFDRLLIKGGGVLDGWGYGAAASFPDEWRVK